MGNQLYAFSQHEAVEYYGANMYSQVPKDLNVKNEIVGVYKRNGGTDEIYHSTFEMNYRSSDFSRQITVRGDKDQKPFSCAVVELTDRQLVPTDINGQNVYFANFGDENIYAEFSDKIRRATFAVKKSPEKFLCQISSQSQKIGLTKKSKKFYVKQKLRKSP